jgi:hypothetical protein
VVDQKTGQVRAKYTPPTLSFSQRHPIAVGAGKGLLIAASVIAVIAVLSFVFPPVAVVVAGLCAVIGIKLGVVGAATLVGAAVAGLTASLIGGAAGGINAGCVPSTSADYQQEVVAFACSSRRVVSGGSTAHVYQSASMTAPSQAAPSQQTALSSRVSPAKQPRENTMTQPHLSETVTQNRKYSV